MAPEHGPGIYYGNCQADVNWRCSRDNFERSVSEEHDVDTLRQISLLLDRENQRLITKNLQLTAELARLRGLPDVEQLAFTVQRELQQARTQIFQDEAAAPPPTPRRPQPGHGPREQPVLPRIEIRHELPLDQRQCAACGGHVTEMAGQYESSERITTVKLTYQVEQHLRQKYRCVCNGAVVTAPGPAQIISGGRYAPAFAVGVAVAKYADHCPLERQVRMMAREGLRVDSQTLWDQIQALARHLEPTYDALGQRSLAAPPVINIDETRWPRLGSSTPATGTVWRRLRADRRLLSDPARQVRRRRAPSPRRLPWDGGRGRLRGV